MKEFKVALIGVGGRGQDLYRASMSKIENLCFVAVCDSSQENGEKTAKEMEENGRKRPAIYQDYKKCIDETMPDVVVIATSWETHLEISMYAMEKGIAVACEVAGAYNLDGLWNLVRCYERTKTPIMLMENCCYGQMELLALEMKRQGLLGKIVHCEGGYHHDLRREMTTRPQHYRIYEYIHRNSENYPTHEIGPIAKLLDINCGNRFVSLVSVGSSAHGLKEYVEKENIEWLKGVDYQQSDIVTTILKCANGETVTITLDTTLPRYYSRGLMVQGTKGLICEENRSVFLETEATGDHWNWKDNFNNIDGYYEKYNHKLWKDYRPGQGGHGGMDYLTFKAFFDALEKGEPMPIDVYDMATWMAITALSEQSLATGQAVAFPDFTGGKWTRAKSNFAL